MNRNSKIQDGHMDNKDKNKDKNKEMPLLKVEGLSLTFRMYDSVFRQKELKVISDLTVSVKRGEILAIVGSSGSGKSLLAHAILGIVPDNATINGDMYYEGRLLTEDMKKVLRGKDIAFVPQSITYLDPLMKVGHQVLGRDRNYKNKIAQKKVFKRFQLEEATEQLYPFQLSGGMARRILVSTAVLGDASLIIADEPTPGMTIEQAMESLHIFRELANEGKGVILITHDIDLGYKFADTIAVFYGGNTLEVGPVGTFYHPYSKALWNALPQNGFVSIPGTQPYPGHEIKGCVFAPRCNNKTEECLIEKPGMKKIDCSYVRCIHEFGS